MQRTQIEQALILAGGALHEDGAERQLLGGPWAAVVCADSGADHALRLGLRPSLLVGDFDSIGSAASDAFRDVPRQAHPSDKAKTDTQLAVEWALDRGARSITIAAGVGSRFDHSLANAQLLSLIHRRGARGVVTDGSQAIYLLQGELELVRPEGRTLSVLPLGTGCKGLSLKGLRWELERFDPELGDTRTISNEFTSEAAQIRLEEGAALVVVGSA